MVATAVVISLETYMLGTEWCSQRVVKFGFDLKVIEEYLLKSDDFLTFNHFDRVPHLYYV